MWNYLFFSKKINTKPNWYEVIERNNRLMNGYDNAAFKKGTPSYLLEQWLAQAGADSKPEDFAAYYLNQSEVSLQNMVHYLDKIKTFIIHNEDPTSPSKNKAIELVGDLWQLVDFIDRAHQVKDKGTDKKLKEVIDKIIESDKERYAKVVQILDEFSKYDNRTMACFITFIEDNPQMAFDAFKSFKEKVKDSSFLCDQLRHVDRKEVISKLDFLESLASAQLRYRNKVNNNRIEWIFGSTSVSALLALAAASYVYRQVLANILHTVCVSIAFHPVASILLLAAAVAGGVYYYRSKDQDSSVTNTDNKAENAQCAVQEAVATTATY